MTYQYTPAQAASLLSNWYSTTGFDDRGGDSMVWSHDLLHILLNQGTSMVEEMVVTCYEAVIPRLLSFDECNSYWVAAGIQYSHNLPFTQVEYQKVVDEYNEHSIDEMLCLADPIWWSQFVREYELLTNPVDEDWLF